MTFVTNEQAVGAARFLVAARQAGVAGPRLPEDLRPSSIEDGLCVQALVGEALGETTGGWKCGAPAENRINVAPIFRSLIYTRSRTSSWSPIPIKGSVARVEQEIAFVMGRDLPARSTPYTMAEVCAAVSEVRLVLELIGSRFLPEANAEYPEALADCLSNEGLFAGPVIALDPADPVLASFPIVVDGPDGIVLEREGRHPDGHPTVPLHWLANFLAERGSGLKAGKIVTTGSYAGALEMPMNTKLTIMFGGLGDIACELVR
ncbi:MAG: 2-keto-4-pentenoate hydratase [Candidatus Solibacter sp.]